MDSIRKPEITISSDMIGIKLPYVQIWECADMGGNEELVPDLDTLVDANGAASLAEELNYLANRLGHAHAVASMEADRIDWEEDPETERPKFIRNSMAKRLGLETSDDTAGHAS